METATMGRVSVKARIENLTDRHLAHAGHLQPEEVRAIEVEDALVDTGMTGLGIPSRLVQQLGLTLLRKRTGLTAAGPREHGVSSGVRLLIQERECIIDVTDVQDACPVCIGQIPLELLDFVVDPVGQRLIGNPAHGGVHMVEMY
jgi:predicted aspartyl protease